MPFFSHPMIESQQDHHSDPMCPNLNPGVRILLKSKWFIDFYEKTADFHLYEIGASETGGAREDGVYGTLDEALARVPEPVEPPKVSPPKAPQEPKPTPQPVEIPPQAIGSLLTEGIERLNLSSRASLRLAANRYRTIGDLVLATQEDLLAIRRFGRGCLEEVEAELAGLGLALRRPPNKQATITSKKVS